MSKLTESTATAGSFARGPNLVFDRQLSANSSCSSRVKRRLFVLVIWLRRRSYIEPQVRNFLELKT